ncbi:MAG: hypothetical protein H7A21_04870 [Spirochaetales bacterium]|nr:hypothetical protein [Spirochaetales bacterium]
MKRAASPCEDLQSNVSPDNFPDHVVRDAKTIHGKETMPPENGQEGENNELIALPTMSTRLFESTPEINPLTGLAPG